MSTASRLRAQTTVGTYTVVTGQTATLGYPARLITATTVQDGTALDDDLIGVFVGAAASATRCEVYLDAPVVPVVVGTGGATLGTKAIPLADGFGDAPAHDSSGATNGVISGVFMETGIATDIVGMMQISGNRGSA